MNEELRKVKYKQKGFGQEIYLGYFHKWTTIKGHGFHGEFAVIEDLNDGSVNLINLEDWEIKFIDRKISNEKDGK